MGILIAALVILFIVIPLALETIAAVLKVAVEIREYFFPITQQEEKPVELHGEPGVDYWYEDGRLVYWFE